MSEILNLDAIGSTRMQDRPCRWGFVRDAFSSRQVAAALAQSFPQDGFAHYRRHSTAKEYDTHGRFLIKMGHGSIFEPANVPTAWHDLAQELLSEAYLDAVEKAAGISLRGSHLEAVFWRLTEGCTIGPHLDNPLKRVSHLLYFNDMWSTSQGGCLRILNSWKLDDVAAEIPPLLGTSLVIVRSRDSWHGYAPVQGLTPRLAMQISFCECAAVC